MEKGSILEYKKPKLVVTELMEGVFVITEIKKTNEEEWSKKIPQIYEKTVSEITYRSKKEANSSLKIIINTIDLINQFEYNSIKEFVRTIPMLLNEYIFSKWRYTILGYTYDQYMDEYTKVYLS